MAIIMDAGSREMMVEQRDVIYWVTLMNENYAQPDVSEEPAPQILRGHDGFNSWQAGLAMAKGGARPAMRKHCKARAPGSPL